MEYSVNAFCMCINHKLVAMPLNMLSYMSDLELFSKIKSLVHTYSYDLNHVLEKDGLYII